MRGGSHLGHPGQPGPGWGILCDLRVGPLSESPYASREDSGQMLGLWLMAADGLYLEMFKATVSGGLLLRGFWGYIQAIGWTQGRKSSILDQ